MSVRPGGPSLLTTSRSRWRTPLLWCGGGVAALLVALGLLGLLFVSRLQPLMRNRLLQTFRERFDSAVTLGDLQVHYNGMLQVDGQNLVVQSVLHGVPGDPARPMLRVQEFHFRFGLWQALSESPRIHHVRIRGVQLDLPPAVAQVSHAPEPKHEVELEYAEVDDAHVLFGDAAPDRTPLQFDLPHLVLRGVSGSRPFRFHAVVDNGLPLGITETDGTIGPWNFDDPRQVPVRGTFGFQDKDMSSVPGLHGRLSLQGTYSGTVGSMEARGTTSDPSFALEVSSRPVALRTDFDFSLDASSSTVVVHDLQGGFGHTSFHVSGEAVKEREPEGWSFDLRLQAPAARVEDVLTLAARTPRPVLRGDMAMEGTLRMRSGTESVARKLSLTEGQFHVGNASFINPGVQQTANGLAARAQGHPGTAAAGTADAARAVLEGTVTMRNEILRFPNMRVSVPGALARMHGSYSLDGTEFRFDGTVHTEAKLSHMTGGVKSALLKPLNGMFTRDGSGATLPLYVEGTEDVPHFGTRIAGIKVKAPGTP